MKYNEINMKSNKDFLLDNFTPFTPEKISNEDDNIYVFCQIITGFDNGDDNIPFVNMESKIVTINKLKSEYYSPLYYIDKRGWDRLQSTNDNIYITLIDSDKYKKYIDNDSKKN